MTRVLVYASSLAAFTVASVLTLVSTIVPRWISYHDTATDGTPITTTYGLYLRCSSTTTQTCTHFPTPTDCENTNFCVLWRTIGFLQTFALVLEAVVVLAFVTVLLGGRKRRERMWGIISVSLLFVAMLQCAAVALATYVYDRDDRFFVGWRLDVSWIFATVSWSVVGVLAGLVALSSWLPPEGGYVELK